MPLLESIRSREELCSLTLPALSELAVEIRRLLLDTVLSNGGHLGPNLGVVELTIALHRVFESPAEPIIWDTGHQAYVHKILTGRADRMPTLRQRKGVSGYPSRGESAHDVVENSHASTALAYADGLAAASRLAGTSDRQIVAVIGDGAMTGGMAWEGLNNIGARQYPNVVVVLNDNSWSYDPTVGGFADAFRNTPCRCLIDDQDRNFSCEHPAHALGFAYVGPVDGHALEEVEAALVVISVSSSGVRPLGGAWRAVGQGVG